MGLWTELTFLFGATGMHDHSLVYIDLDDIEVCRFHGQDVDHSRIRHNSPVYTLICALERFAVASDTDNTNV